MTDALRARLTRLPELTREYLPADEAAEETASLVVVLAEAAQHAMAELRAQEVALQGRLQQQRAARICSQLEEVLERAERLADRLELLAPDPVRGG